MFEIDKCDGKHSYAIFVIKTFFLKVTNVYTQNYINTFWPLTNEKFSLPYLSLKAQDIFYPVLVMLWTEWKEGLIFQGSISCYQHSDSILKGRGLD